MKITRHINGEKFDFELSLGELRDAYFEQEHNYDLEDIKAVIPTTDSDPDNWVEFIEEYGIVPCTVSEDEMEDMATELRRNIDKHNMEFSNARDNAIRTVIAKRPNKGDTI